MASTSEFEVFYRTHYVALMRYVERRIADPETAREVCAECFVVAWRKFDPAQPPGRVWLYRVAHHLLGNAYRGRDRQLALLDRLREAPGPSDTDAVELVAEAMAELEEDEREVLRLTYWEGLSAAEIGVVLGISEQAVWKRASRARAAVRDMVARTIATGEGV